jgi:type IV secretory pathway VirB3-like protein
LANNKKPLVSQNPAFNFALLFVLLQPILSAILQIPLIAVFEISKQQKKNMANAQQAQLSTAFHYLNDNFYCENSPVHQIELILSFI